MKHHVNIRTGTAQVTSCAGTIGDRDRIRIDSLEISPTHVILYGWTARWGAVGEPHAS